MANGFGKIWHRTLRDPKTHWGARIGYFVFIVFFAPVMLVGLPFVLLARLTRNKAKRPSKTG